MRPIARLPLATIVASAATGIAVACLGGNGSDHADRSAGDAADAAGAVQSRAAAASGSAGNVDWAAYLGDPGRSHHSPLAQIDRTNVARLEPVWSFDTGPLESALSQIQSNPIVIDGVLFGTTPRSQVFALDAATGEERWRFDPLANGSAAQGHNRGLVHWEGPAGEGGRILAACGQDLWALDAKTGRPIESFGRGGRIDLRAGLAHGASGG